MPECIETACTIYRIIKETEYLDKKGKLKNSPIWYEQVSKGALPALIMAFETNYGTVLDLLNGCADFKPLAKALVEVYDHCLL